MLVKEFLFGNSKFSAFNNDHFVTLFVIVGLFTAYYSLYCTGRFYAAYYDVVKEYMFMESGSNDRELVQGCNVGQHGDCLLIGFVYTGFLTVSFAITTVSFLYKHVLFYLFFAYFFYTALPSICIQYSRFCAENKLKTEKK